MRVSDHIREGETEAAKPDLKVKFPHHNGLEAAEKIYKIFDDFERQHKRHMMPHQKAAMDKALGTFVTLLAQLKRAEESLYYTPKK
jgi:hypothetical protein